MSWIDSHCHLDFDDFSNPSSLIEELSQTGCERILVPAVSQKYFDRVTKFQDEFSSLTDMALGLHPYFIDDHCEGDLKDLDNLLSLKKAVAVGEVGLDYVLPNSSWEKQQQIFEEQVGLAKLYNLPLVIHCRKAHDQLHKILKQYNFTCGGFIHGFSGSYQQAKKYLDQGFLLGMGGALTHDRAKAMHRLVAQLPDDGFVLETDSPDMRPSFETGSINTPLNIPKIAEYISELRQQPLAAVLEKTTKNYYSIITL